MSNDQLQKQKKSLHPTWMLILAIILPVFFGAIYIVQMNSTTVRGYAVRDLEHDVRALELQNAKLSEQLTDAQSLDAISEKIKMMGMVPDDDVQYLKPADTAAMALLKKYE